MNPLRFFWGLVVVLLGLVLIATNAGWISTGVWWSILMLWPVLLIILGLKLLLHNNVKLFMVLTLLVVLLSAGYVLAINQNKWQLSFSDRSHVNLGSDVFSENLTDTFDVSQGKKLILNVSTGAAEIALHALPEGTNADVLYETKTQSMGKFTVVRTQSADVISLNLTEQSNGFQLGSGLAGLNRRIDISLPASLMLDLNLSSGASSLTADLSGLTVVNTKFSIGASSGNVILSDKVAKQTLNLSAGASSLTFKVPAGLGVKATFEGGLNSVDSASVLGFTKSGDTYTTAGFDTSAKQLVISGSAGVSSIKFLQK